MSPVLFSWTWMSEIPLNPYTLNSLFSAVFSTVFPEVFNTWLASLHLPTVSFTFHAE